MNNIRLEQGMVDCPNCNQRSQVGRKFISLTIKCYLCSACGEWLTPSGKPKTLLSDPIALKKHYKIYPMVDEQVIVQSGSNNA